MARKKSNTTKIIASIILVLILVVGAYFVINSFSDEDGPPLLAIGDQCNLAGSGTIDNVFTCPSNCDVFVTKECNVATSEARVIFRTNANSKEDYNTRTSLKWVAIRGIISGSTFNPTDNLQVYCVSSSAGGSRTSPINIDTVYNTRLWAWNGNLYVETGSTGDVIRQYYLCNNQIDQATLNTATQSTPVPGYSSKERLGGTDQAYSCSTPYYVNSVLRGNAQYSGSNSGTAVSNVFRIGDGDRVTFSGDITYAIIDESNACVVSTCNSLNTGYTKCEVVNGCPQKTTNVDCNLGEVCQNGATGAKCISPIQFLTAGFQDQEGTTRGGFAVGEDIYFSYHISSDTAHNANVIIELRDLSNNLITSKIEQLTFPNPTTKVVSFTGLQNTGTYKVVLKVTYDGDKTVTPQEYQFRVANTISMEIVGSSAGAVKTIYTNAPAIVEIKVFGEDGKFTSAETTLSATLVEGNKRTPVTPSTTDFKDGVYDYIFNLPAVQVDAILQVTGSANKLGFRIEQTKDLVVKPANVNIEFSNIGLLQDLDTGISKTVTIETKNPQLDFIDVDSIVVTAELPGGRTDTTPINVQRTALGKYEFTYTFGQTSGAYFFNVNAQKTGFISRPLKSSAINVAPGGGTGYECVENNECGTGKICVSNSCVEDNVGGSTFIWYAIYFVGAILIVFIIIVVVRIARRPKREVSSSITGL